MHKNLRFWSTDNKKYNVKKDKLKVKQRKTDLNFMHEFYLSKKYITSLITNKKEDDEGIAFDIIMYHLNIIIVLWTKGSRLLVVYPFMLHATVKVYN